MVSGEEGGMTEVWSDPQSLAQSLVQVLIVGRAGGSLALTAAGRHPQLLSRLCAVQLSCLLTFEHFSAQGNPYSTDKLGSVFGSAWLGGKGETGTAVLGAKVPWHTAKTKPIGSLFRHQTERAANLLPLQAFEEPVLHLLRCAAYRASELKRLKARWRRFFADGFGFVLFGFPAVVGLRDVFAGRKAYVVPLWWPSFLQNLICCFECALVELCVGFVGDVGGDGCECLV